MTHESPHADFTLEAFLNHLGPTPGPRDRPFTTLFTAELPVDVVEEADAVVVTADVPGCEPGDITVFLPSAETLELTVAAADDSEESAAATAVFRERPQGELSRRIRLPARVQPDAATAAYQDGVLTVTLPKQADATETTIPVE